LEEIAILKNNFMKYPILYFNNDFSLTNKCKLCFFYRECSNYFLNNLRFECISGVGPKYAEILKKLGFESVEQLAKINPDQIVHKSKNSPTKNIGMNFATKIVTQAQAIVKNNLIQRSSNLEKINLEENDVIFDLEYDLDGTIFSISLGIVNEKGNLRYYNWFAKDYKNSKKIVKDFFNFLKENRVKKVAGWSINTADIPKLRQYSSLPTSIKTINALLEIRKQIFFPLFSYGLKEIYHYLYGSNNLDQTDIQSGLDAVFTYHRFLETEDKYLKNQIIEYNKEDAQKTFEIIKWFNERCEKGFKN